METENVPVEDLFNDPTNARMHSPRNIDAIKGSLQRFGQQKPIVVDADNIVRAGNGTLEAARGLGWTEISVVRSELIGPEMTAFAIADNRTAELAEWDEETLARTLEALPEDIPTDDTGFSTEEMQGMLDSLRGPADVEEDHIPEPPSDPITQPGDIWVLGKHRLLCGDCLAPGNAEALLDGGIPAMAFTDPPYNVAYNSQESPPGSAWGHTGRGVPIANDNMGEEEWRIFTLGIAALLKGWVDGCVYVCHAPGPDGRVMASALDQTLHWSGSLVWVKNQMVFGRASYQRRHEVIWFGWPDGCDKAFTDDRTITDVWEFPKPKRSDLHPTMKPIALVAQAIQHASRREQIVFDPFLGSGTTLIAAEQLGRACYGTELEPAYCDVIVKRWETITEQTAERVEGVVRDRTTDSMEEVEQR